MKTIIYKIYCKDEKIKECYIGRTEIFKRRFLQHRQTCNEKFITYSNGNIIEGVYKKRTKLYDFIRINGGFDNWIMEPIEEYLCKDNDEATDWEWRWIKKTGASLNTYLI
jgi:hypothetical protein